MPHIHEKIDFTSAIFVVENGRVLMIHHRKLEQAALREAKEESGLDVELIGERPPTTGPGTRALIAPRFLDIHRISDTHEHIGLIYFARPRSGTTTLAREEHHDIRWCTKGDLGKLDPPMSDAVMWYALKAIEEVTNVD